jgi:hypothetical protein
MPIALAIAALLLIIVSVQGTEKEFGALLGSEFQGPNNFMFWLAALIMIGTIGYIPALKKLSDSLLLLVMIVIFLANGGFWSKLTAALNTTTAPTPSTLVTPQSPSAPNNPATPHLDPTLFVPTLGAP